MLKIVSFVISFFTIFSVYADCEISQLLKNKACSADYFTAKNSKQLNEYLQYGKFKDGKLLNLEIGFDVKEKEINIGTTCDLKFKFNADLRASLNGICLQAKSIFTRRQSSFFADKKAPIVLIANDSVKIRRTNIQTLGDINISTKSYDPFSNEILISRDSQILARKLYINTPSSLIINDNSRIKSSNVVLNGGNCEVGDSDDQDNDDNRDRERQCIRFKPKFTYTGTCLNNPIPTSLKISSQADKTDSLKLTYSIVGASSGTSIKWKFDNEIESSNMTAVQSFLFPGKHLAEAVVSSSNGYFRILGSYNNISPMKFSKGQVAIFQFNGLQNGPSKVMALMGVKKFNLIRSEYNSEIYTGEIPVDSAGKKLIAIPELGYKGSFNLVTLPKISNPGEYIDQQIGQYENLIKDITTIGIDLSGSFEELKIQINNLSDLEKRTFAETLQANLSSSIPSFSTSFSEKKNIKKLLLDLIISEAQASGEVVSDKSITRAMLEVVAFNILGPGVFIPSVVSGVKLMRNPLSPVPVRLAGATMASLGVVGVCYWIKADLDLLTLIRNPVRNMLISLVGSNVFASELTTFNIRGQFVGINPEVDLKSESSLIRNTIISVNNANKLLYSIDPLLSTASSLALIVSPNIKIPSVTKKLSFPQDNVNGDLSAEYIKSVTLVGSDLGNVSLTSFSKTSDGFQFIMNSQQTQNVTIRIFYENPDLGISFFKDYSFKVLVVPSAVINYTKNNLVVNFEVTDPQNPDVIGLTYSWNFGDGKTMVTQSKSISHTYSSSGNYNVTLVVSDSFGESSTSTAVVQVQSGCLVSFKFCSQQFYVSDLIIKIQGKDPFTLVGFNSCQTVLVESQLLQSIEISSSDSTVQPVNYGITASVYDSVTFGLREDGYGGYSVIVNSKGRYPAVCQ